MKPLNVRLKVSCFQNLQVNDVTILDFHLILRFNKLESIRDIFNRSN